MDNVWSIMGKAAHTILEQHAPEDSLSEERLYVDILGRRVGGKVDCYHSGTITDYKITSAWTLVFGDRIGEWEEQLNSYAYILRQNAHPVDRLQIVAILRDWDKVKAIQDPTRYPQTPIVVLPINLWDEQVQHSFLKERIALLKDNEERSDSTLQTCFPSEMWEQPPKYAVMKPEGKRAIKLFDNRDAAFDWIEEQRDKHRLFVQVRGGIRKRCLDYCNVSKFCTQHKEYTNS